jgi:hypothetical protein
MVFDPFASIRRYFFANVLRRVLEDDLQELWREFDILIVEETDGEVLERIEGLYVGLLNQDDYAAFQREVSAGRARYSYVGVGGFMGLAIVAIGPEDFSNDVE